MQVCMKDPNLLGQVKFEYIFYFFILNLFWQEKYAAEIDRKYGSDVASQPILDVDAWIDANEGPTKRLIYGFGTKEIPIAY